MAVPVFRIRSGKGIHASIGAALMCYLAMRAALGGVGSLGASDAHVLALVGSVTGALAELSVGLVLPKSVDDNVVVPVVVALVLEATASVRMQARK